MKLTKKISAVVLAALMAVVAIFAGCSSTKRFGTRVPAIVIVSKLFLMWAMER